jgi:hypothetical protein
MLYNLKGSNPISCFVEGCCWGTYHKRYTRTEPKAQKNTALAVTAATRDTTDITRSITFLLAMEFSVWCSHWCAAAAGNENL